MSTISSVNYICLNVGYVERLIKESSGVPDTKELNVNSKIYNAKVYKGLSCKENHNATLSNNSMNSSWPRGEFSCTNNQESCYCCDYYEKYPEESTWEPDELDEEANGNTKTEPLPFEPYKVVAILDTEVHFDEKEEQEVCDFLNDFPNLEAFGSIIFKRRDGKPIALADYRQVANSIRVLFCGCYSPNAPYEMKIMLGENSRLLYLNYDTESG
jgi:hypothetical protein